MKYCIGCQHLYFKPGHGDDQCGSTMTGAWGAEDAELSCQKDHWKLELGEYGNVEIFDIEAAMKKAETCGDYTERSSGEGKS